MLYSVKNREALEKLEELVSLKNQVVEAGLQDKLGKQNFHQDIIKLYEPHTGTIKSTSENKTKTMMLISKENNKALENLNDKLLKKMNDRFTIVNYLLSPLSKITNLENTSQFQLVKDPNSNRVNGLVIHNTIPVSV